MISGFVINYNRADTLQACLRSIRFVDELIVIDKSSTDNSFSIAESFADKVLLAPWSPTVEETRATALEMCDGDFIVFLDADEVFSHEAVSYLSAEGKNPLSDLYMIPCRHHVIGRHDERAYYWPERHLRAFKRGSLNFTSKVHGGYEQADRIVAAPEPATGICFHNISHLNTAEWIEKTNRYTSNLNRNSSFDVSADIIDVSRSAIERWAEKLDSDPDDYLKAVAMLRAVYDIVDSVKRWEQSEGLNHTAMFSETCRKLEADLDELETRTGIRTRKAAAYSSL